MQFKIKMIPALVALFLLAIGAPYVNAAGKNVNRTDRDFVQDSAKDNLALIELSNLAESKSSNPDVKNLAKQMAQDATAANQQLMKIAQNEGITFPKQLDRDQRADVDTISKVNGPRFDHEYLSYAIRENKDNVKDFSKAAQNSNIPQLKTFASNELNTLTNDLNIAEKLKQEVG